jgi:hypothetical protein
MPDLTSFSTRVGFVQGQRARNTTAPLSLTVRALIRDRRLTAFGHRVAFHDPRTTLNEEVEQRRNDYCSNKDISRNPEIPLELPPLATDRQHLAQLGQLLVLFDRCQQRCRIQPQGLGVIDDIATAVQRRQSFHPAMLDILDNHAGQAQLATDLVYALAGLDSRLAQFPPDLNIRTGLFFPAGFTGGISHRFVLVFSVLSLPGNRDSVPLECCRIALHHWHCQGWSRRGSRAAAHRVQFPRWLRSAAGTHAL